MALRVLLVEDNADLRREIHEYLSRRFHKVIAVGSRAEAQDFLGRSFLNADPVSVVLCDVNLEDGSGVDLFVEFAPLRPACHWILMSGDPDLQHLTEERRRVPSLPPCTVVSKPVSLRSLAALISGDRPP